MTIHAFMDDADGYYQIDLPDGAPLPLWTSKLVPCAVRPAAQPSLAESVLAQIIKLEQDNPITHRTLRDVILAMGLVVQQVTGKPAAANPYYVKLAVLNAQIDAMAESIRSAP